MGVSGKRRRSGMVSKAKHPSEVEGLTTKDKVNPSQIRRKEPTGRVEK